MDATETGAQTQSDTAARTRLAAGFVSLIVGIALLALKYYAYVLTGSAAVLSDALESIINVVAAAFALGGLVFAGRPADRNHPYGHGKIEFFSAVFEGGLITFAAIVIVYQAFKAMLYGVEVREADLGLVIVLGAGLVNAVLGWFLVRTGKRHNSLTLVADGQHVLSDFWTSAGVTVGLVLVMVTGIDLFDPIVALLVGVNLGFTGWKLVREAAGGLLDEEDTTLVERILGAINANLTTGIIRVHYLRAIRAGRFTHVDAHLVVPEFWTVDRAHDLADAFEARVIEALPFDGEIAFHTDPCRRVYCRQCDVADCPIRTTPFERRIEMTLEEAVRDDLALRRQGGLPRT